jgi:hypothetical protein
MIVVSKASPALDYRKDIVLKDKIAEGGAAVIHLATIKTAKMRNRLNMGENEQVVVKILKGTLYCGSFINAFTT